MNIWREEAGIRVNRNATMSEVILNVYDVTNSVSVKTNSAIVQFNRLLRDGIGLGGIFHGGIQVYEEEWSFGYCENGSGVFSCQPKENPLYTYRESVSLGYTTLSETCVNHILVELSREWPGYSYDLLARNCNHFCDEFSSRLGVQKPPAWVNRFANAGDVAVEVAGNTMERLRQAKSDLMTAGRIAFRFLFGGNPTMSNTTSELVAASSTLGTSLLAVSESSMHMHFASPSLDRVAHIHRMKRFPDLVDDDCHRLLASSGTA